MISLSSYPYDAIGKTSYDHLFLADLIMSTEEDETKDAKPAKKENGAKMGADFGASRSSGLKHLFLPENFDIYCDCENGQNYIFHKNELNCTVDHLEYDPETQRITVYTNDGQKLDLGARIQWLVRPYIAKDQNIFIVRTQDGKTIDGIDVPLIVKTQEKLENQEQT
ncbi:MAG: hypothetical protein OEY94_03220 [Alphaproteobacteria bacterium]|nr:hypothetical protein [Alphaproteobacteria bacterium]